MKQFQKSWKKSISPDKKILHQKFTEYGANAKEWMRKCILLLPEIAKYRIWEEKGFGNIYEYAAKLAGMSRNTVDDALRILKKIEGKPELQKVVEQKGLNAVRPVVTIATSETAEFWAEKAIIMSKNTLEMYVKEFRTGTGKVTENPQQQAVVMQLDPAIAEQLQKLKGNGDWNEVMKELLKIRKEKLEQEKPEAVETDSRHIPTRIKKHVLQRTNGICSFASCTKPAEILHHTQRYALENLHDPNRIEPLCKAHERLVHLGLIAGEQGPAHEWRVREEPDQTEEKFLVDAVVARYRNFKKSS